MSQLRFISKVLYRLKRRYGLQVNVIKLISSETNLETGVATPLYDSLMVNRAIVLPRSLAREFFQDLAYISQNKSFSYGGNVDTQTSQFIFDTKDLNGWTLDVGDTLIYATKRFDIKISQLMEENAGYLITAKESQAVTAGNVISLSIFDDLLLDSEATCDKS